MITTISAILGTAVTDLTDRCAYDMIACSEIIRIHAAPRESSSTLVHPLDIVVSNARSIDMIQRWHSAATHSHSFYVAVAPRC